MRSRVRILLAVPLLLAAAACGGSDDSDSDAGAADTTPAAADTDSTDDSSTDDSTADTDSTDDSAADTDSTDDSSTPTMPTMPEGLETGGDGTATLTLENGETYEFDGVLCALEPQTVAGSEILFSATSYGDPSLDATQFGEGTLADMATIDVYDTNYETLWEAFDMGTGSVELTLDGNTITGSASFYDGAGELAEPVQGELLVNC